MTNELETPPVDTTPKTPEQLAQSIMSKLNTAIPEVLELKALGYEVSIGLLYGDPKFSWDGGKERFNLTINKEVKL